MDNGKTKKNKGEMKGKRVRKTKDERKERGGKKMG